MKARRAKPEPIDPLSIPEESVELEELADALWMIRCGLDTNGDPDRLYPALGGIERGIRRVGHRVGETIVTLRKAVAR